MTPEQPLTTGSPASRPRRKVFRWVLLAAAIAFFLAVFREALNPFGDRGYTEISHGNHAHYVPEDRDPAAPIHNFPTAPPGPNERILPDGRVVPK